MGAISRKSVPNVKKGMYEFTNPASSRVNETVCVETNASDIRIGALLMQDHNRKLFPVSYASS